MNKTLSTSRDQSTRLLLLPSPLPLDYSRSHRLAEKTAVISANDLLTPIRVEELEVPDHGREDGLQLDIGELFTDAPMSAGTER